MPTLLQINVVANSGSTGRIAEDIGKLAISQGWKSYIAYGRGKPNSSSQLIPINNYKLDFYIHAIQTRLLDNHGLASSHNTKRLIKIIQKINPDIIHLHNIHGYYINYSILFKYLCQTKIPIVWTLHDCWSYTGHCSHYSYIKCNKWQYGCYNCPQKERYPASWFIDRSPKNYNIKKRHFTSLNNLTIVTVSKWLEKEVKKSFLKNLPINTIYNGIDINIFKPQNISKSEKCTNFIDKFIVLGVANVWDNYKGLKDFIEIRKSLPDDYIIILIGLNSKQIRELPNGIIGIQRTNNMTELAQYYSIADVYLNTSIEETYGMTTCESMACGTPVIVYNSTALPELVTKETGFVVEPGDLNNVISILKSLKSSNKDKYSNACRNRVIHYFNKDERFIEYLDLYKNLIDQYK